MSTKIFIGNLNEDVDSDALRALFEKYGKVDECDVLKNYGFVHMPDKSEANAAIANLNGYNIKGQRMRVELSTGKRGNPKGDRRGSDREMRDGRSRPYPPGPPRRGPPPPDYDRYDPYYRYPYPERDPYYRLPPVDRYLPPRLPPVDDRYPPLRRERLLPEERGAYLPPDPRDRLMARERLPLYPDDPYDRRLVERAPPVDPYYRERSPVARPPPEYYDRKSALMRSEAGNPPLSRLNTTAYPPSNGYDYYRRPAEAPERPSYNGPAGGGQDYKNGPPARGGAGYDRPAPPQQQQRGPGGVGGYGMPPQQQQQMPQQQQKRYDSQSALQTKPIFF
ncbi:uncharacterized protein LOC143296711 [Babylonia areolata]|uniref:uncharacterized protein LOC143296711 n=1 Tax=Babylonia areolata TaxID=304850 RepID=UPI003FD5E2D8